MHKEPISGKGTKVVTHDDQNACCRMWIKKFLNVNIVNFENVDKPEGGGSDNVDKVIL